MEPNPDHQGNALFLPEALRAFELEVEEYPGWEKRGQGDLGTIWGVVLHKSGSNHTPASSVAEGSPDLPGLRAQTHLSQDGKITVVGSGIAWHTGKGRYKGLPTNDANSVTLGLEIATDGRGHWPDEQYEACVTQVAAILEHLQLPSDRCISLREWRNDITYGKDGLGIDMDVFRQAVLQHRLDEESDEEETDMWNELAPSLLSPEKEFTRQEFLQLTDFHAAKANQQSKKTLEVLEVLMTEVANLRQLVLDLQNKDGKGPTDAA